MIGPEENRTPDLRFRKPEPYPSGSAAPSGTAGNSLAQPKERHKGDTTARRPNGLSREALIAHVESRCTFEPNTGCWLWLGAEVRGYARMAWGSQKSGTVTRFLLDLEPGNPLEALHECDNCACVNPRHLRVGTHAENQADMKRRGRARAGRREAA